MSVTLPMGVGLGPAAELIFGDWYPAARVGELRAGKTLTTVLLGIPMLLGRKRDGAVFAMRDLCPHRGIPLSAGWFDGETVQCKYHGWRFEPCSGQCTEIPSLTSFETLDATKIYASAFPCEERDGYLWVYVPGAGEGRVTEGLRAVPELPKFSEQVPERASAGGAAVQCGSRDYRVDGSGAWAVCAPGVVVAVEGVDPREDEAL